MAMEDPQEGRPNEAAESSTAARVEDWLRNLRAQRAAGAETSSSRAGRSGTAADDPAEAFLRAARRLASSPKAQEALARRLADAGTADDPSLRALASVLEALGREIAGALSQMDPAGGGAAAVLDRPDVYEERRLSDDEGGGGDDDIFD